MLKVNQKILKMFLKINKTNDFLKISFFKSRNFTFYGVNVLVKSDLINRILFMTFRKSKENI